MKPKTRPKSETIKLHITVSKENFEKIKSLFPYMSPSVMIDYCFDLVLKSKIYSIKNFSPVEPEEK